MKRLSFLLFTLLLCGIGLYAQQRSESEAIQIAQNFFREKGIDSHLSVVPYQKINVQVRKAIGAVKRMPSQNQGFYVVNDETNNRFVIVSADERLNTILGYSDYGTFSPENMPDALLEFLDGYNSQYDYLLGHAEAYKKNDAAKTPTHAIEPLIKTKWGQGTPFNGDCPVNNRATDGSKCASGCVATAMAQVMNYHQYPTKGIGAYSYTSSTQKHRQSMDFSSTTFDWAIFLDTYDDKATNEQKAEIAKLMHACGVSVSMDYGVDSDGQSGACPYDIVYAMINYFGYNPNTVFKMKDYYSAEEWDAIIMQELEAGRPLLYGGRGTGGHRFILDGCNADGLYHFNFGWTLPGLSIFDGYGNGYYSLDAICPKDLLVNTILGEEVDLGDFSNEQSLVCQISPNAVGIHEDIFYSSDFTLSTNHSVKIGDWVDCSYYVVNYSSSTSTTDPSGFEFDGEVGIGLYDTSFNYLKSLNSSSFDRKSGDGRYFFTHITFSADAFANGKQYIIAPYAKANGSKEPTRARASYGKGWYLAKVNNGRITLVQNGIPDDDGDVQKAIPTGTIYASAMGKNSSQVIEDKEKPTKWKLTLTRDAEETSKYWFDHFDPAVEGPNNKVYGIADTEGTQIRIPTRQSIGENLTITNYEKDEDIVVYVSTADNTMRISNVWGTIGTDTSGDNAEQTQVSIYTSTSFSFKPFSEDGSEEVVVSKPLITVNKAKMLNIVCSTEGAEIRYTLNGNTPTVNSTLYTAPIQLTENCTVKAIAIKDGKNSEVTIFEEDGFVAEKPVISANQTIVTIACATSGADIYYTLDESAPSKNKTKYTTPFECTNNCVIKAIAVKNNYKDSEVTTYVHNVSLQPSEDNITIADLTAGSLSTRIVPEKKLQIVGLTISSGNMNGTDIHFIREMIQEGKLANLDMEGASIVSGGEAYYVSTTGTKYMTSDNVIGGNMFFDCKGLFSLSLPASTTTIEGFALQGCKNLKQIVLPRSCTTVENFGIYGCKNLERVVISAATSCVSPINMELCPNLRYIDVEGGNKSMISVDGILFSKDMSVLMKYPAAHAEASYSVPVSVKTISDNAFSSVRLLESVAIPNGVKEIGASAFSDCKGLHSLVIPNSVEAIGSMAFYGCSNLSSITLSQNIKKLGSLVFGYDVSLQKVVIPVGVKDIVGSAFAGCSSLKEISVDTDNALFTSYNGALYTKNMKKVVKCPIALYASSYQIPEGVEEISDNAFDGCKNIESFILPKTVKSIGSSAFSNCNMSSISLPEDLSYVGSMVFSDCEQLESLVIPENVEDIPMMFAAFCDKLSYLYLPANVKKIGLSAFSRCKAMTMVYSQISDIDMVDFSESYGGEYEQFAEVSDTCTWRIPMGCSERYKAQPWWVSTWKIIEDATPNGIRTASGLSLDIKYENGRLIILSNKDVTLPIYDINGIWVKSVAVKSGEFNQTELPHGIYIIDNRKIVLM